MARFEVCLLERQLTSQLHREGDVPTHRPDFWPWPLTAVSCDTFHWGDSADVHIFRPTIVLPLWLDYCSTFNPDNEDLGSPYDSVWDLVECQYNTKTMNLLSCWFCRIFMICQTPMKRLDFWKVTRSYGSAFQCSIWNKKSWVPLSPELFVWPFGPAFQTSYWYWLLALLLAPQIGFRSKQRMHIRCKLKQKKSW